MHHQTQRFLQTMDDALVACLPGAVKERVAKAVAVVNKSRYLLSDSAVGDMPEDLRNGGPDLVFRGDFRKYPSVLT